MPTHSVLYKRVELLELRVARLEYELKHIKDKPQQKRGPRRRTYEMWQHVITLTRNGMNKRNTCETLGICYSTLQAYLRMSEAEARQLPSAKELKERLANKRNS